MYFNKPLVSVCIPCYKYIDLFKRCLKSILEQSYTNIEIIITDDSRDDNIKNLVSNEYLDNRIKYFKNEIQLGSPANWNEGLKKAKGKYIKMMHHDDWFSETDGLKMMVNQMEDSQGDFGFCDCISVFPEHKKKHEIPKLFLKKWKKHNEIILLANYVGPPSVTIFRNVPNKQILFDIKTKWLVDILFYYEYLSINKELIHIKSSLINVTAGHATQITNSQINNTIELNEFYYVNDKLPKKVKEKFNFRIASKIEFYILEFNVKFKKQALTIKIFTLLLKATKFLFMKYIY